jgi:hypothetical protein
MEDKVLQLDQWGSTNRNMTLHCNIQHQSSVYRVSHNTWDYKNALGRALNGNVESWEVSHFEAKDHTFQTQGVRF